MNKLLFITALLIALSCTMAFARFDLQSFDSSTIASSVSNDYAHDLAVGSSNPTVGTRDGSLVLEFTAGAVFTAGVNSFLAILPGYDCDETSLSRFSAYDTSGTLVKQTAWLTRSQWSGSIVDASIDTAIVASSATSANNFVSPFEAAKFLVYNIAPISTTPLRVFWPAQFTIGVGFRIRIELKNIRLPPSFSCFSQECRNAFAAADSSELFIQDQDCCKEFEIKIGAAVGIAVGNVAAKQVVVASISAKFCPNYGTNDNPPPVCTTTPTSQWNDRLRFTCCQYDAFSDTPACDIVWCRENTHIDPARPLRCCNVEWTTVTNPMCPHCTPGNWEDNCCDYITTIGGKPVIDEVSFERYKNNPYCLYRRCQCEDWGFECCPLEDSTPFFNSLVCSTCDEDYFHPRCCTEARFKETPQCLCYGPDFRYDPDFCCDKPDFHIISLCPVSPTCGPEENSCDCDCDEEPSCPCVLLAQLNAPSSTFSETSTPPGDINYVKYEKHEMAVSNVQSGHNTVVINHLHIDTHINLHDADDLAKLQELLPSLIFNINSGCSSVDPITAIANVVKDIVTGVKTQVKSDLDSIKTVVGNVKSDVKDVVKDVIGTAGGVVAGLGKCVRVVIKIACKAPLNAIELIALRLMIITQCALSGKPQSGFSVAFVNQFALGVSANQVGIAATEQVPGYGITVDVSEASSTQNDVKSIFDNQSSGLQSAISKQFGAAQISSSNIVAASNECGAGTCTSSCMCELYHPCDSDDQCLSSKCDFSSSAGKKVCIEADGDASGTNTFFNEYILGAIVIAASSLLVIFQQYQ